MGESRSAYVDLTDRLQLKWFNESLEICNARTEVLNGRENEFISSINEFVRFAGDPSQVKITRAQFSWLRQLGNAVNSR